MEDRNEYRAGTTPVFRVGLKPRGITPARGYRCPFCGENSLIVAGEDVVDDPDRLELYCINDRCATRVMTVLVRQSSLDHHVRERADNRALQAVDDGTIEELETRGWTYNYREDGTVSARIGSGVKPAVEAAAKLRNRRRPTRIVVEPE